MRQKLYAKIALFVTAMLWGSTFAIGKLATEVFSASFIIALRFSVAGIALVIVSIPFWKLLNKQYWIDGIWMGITLFGGYILQVGGLALDTSPGKVHFCVPAIVSWYRLCIGLPQKSVPSWHIFWESLSA